jgi:hypothetical protein
MDELLELLNAKFGKVIAEPKELITSVKKK